MAVKKYKRDSSVSYAFGATLVMELLKTNPDIIERVFLRPSVKHGENLDKILNILKSKNIEIIESNKAFNILGAKDNCLLIAEFRKQYKKLDRGLRHIVLVNPSDSGNLGTIMRSAAAFGYKNLAIITPGVDPYDPKTIRASMGAVFHLDIATFPSITDYIQDYADKRKFYAFILNPGATILGDVKPAKNYSLIFGNEAAGLPKDFIEQTGAEAIFIPQNDAVDSLNLSVAASIAMYQFATK